MIARTTIAMDQELLRSLKKVSQERKCRSLSELIKEVLQNFLNAFQNKKLYRRMARDYQEYAAHRTPKDIQAFHDFEAAALEDLISRK